jgi:hypothetical protein
MPQFDIEVGGNVAPLTRSLSELKARLKEIQAEIGQSKDPVALIRLNAELAQVRAEMQAIHNLGPVLPAGAVAGINQATQATGNFGRVLQDLPFGFIGIANNLNPLLESFQRLRAETGSSRAAITALGSSLLGAGGLGLALSAVTAILSFSSIGLQAWGVKNKEAKEQADKLKDVLKDVNLIAAEAAAETEGQIAKVNALAAVISDTNVAYTQRKRALEELKEVNKNYFNDLTLEDAATSKLRDTINEYTAALVNSAIQKEFVNDIAKVAKAAVDADDDIAKARQRLSNARSETKKVLGNDEVIQALREGKASEDLIPIIQKQTNARHLGTLVTEESARLINAEKDAEEELSKVNAKTTDLLVQKALLTDKLNRAVLEGTKFKDLDSTKSKKEEDELKKRLEALERIKKITDDPNALVGLQESIFDLQVRIAVRDQGKNHITDAELQTQVKGFKTELQKAFDNQANALELSPTVKFSPVLTVDVPAAVTDRISKAVGKEKITVTLHEVRVKFLGEKQTKILEGTEAINAQLSKEINDSFANLQIDLSTTLGEQLGASFADALQGGDLGESLKKAAQALLGVLGTTMQQIGRSVIAAAIKIKLLKETLTKWAVANPALAIVAGIGLVAAGAALKNLTFDGPKFAQGGIVTGPTIGLVGEAGKEAIIPLSKLPDMIGGKGGGTVVVNSTLGVRGRELVALITTESKRFNRIN